MAMENLKQLNFKNMIKKIITHNGSAHQDEFLASCILLAKESNISSIIRVSMDDPRMTQFLNNKEYCVIDIGRQLNSELENYDHHQDVNLPCSFTLILDKYGIREKVFECFSWARVVCKNDTKGIIGAVESFNVGLPTDLKYKFVYDSIFSNPMCQFILSKYEKYQVISNIVNEDMFEMMKEFGNWILSEVDKLDIRKENLEKYHKILNINGFFGIDISDIPDDGMEPSFGFGAWSNLKGYVVDFIVNRDTRSENAVRIVRYNTKIDLLKIKDNNGIIFAHANGFLATMTKDSISYNLKDLFLKTGNK